MKREEVEKLVNDLNKSLAQNNWQDLTYLVEHDSYFALQMDITWGDWKHEHWYARDFVEKFLDSRQILYFYSEVCTEEDGSDTYSATHIWRIIE